MKIIKNHKQNKSEDVAVVPFLEFYFAEEKNDLSFSAIPEGKTKQPDYYVDATNTAIEIKEIHDRQSNQKHAQWSKIVSKLQQAVDKNSLLSQVKGTFLINTPEVFKTPTEQKAFVSASTEILKAVIVDDKKINIFGVDFEINKVSDQETIVVFGTYGGGGSINPSDTVYQNIKDKIVSANNQLVNSPAGTNKRILLLSNKYYMPLWDWDLFKAIGRTYEDLITHRNIDEVWYQFETKEQGFVHQLLYKKSFFEQFENTQFNKLDKDDYSLFANWFSVLSEMGPEKKVKLLVALQEFLKDKKPYEIFPNNQTREEMVRFGLWLDEEKMFDEAIWLIKQFIDDPNPPDPKDYSKEEKFNYDQKIRDNDNVNTITTVLGHLAWVIQKLAVRQEHIVTAFGFTKTLLAHPNLYIKLQALIPLIEIAIRRQWLEDYDKKNKTEIYKEFHSEAFDLLNNYSQYKPIANWIARVFYYFKDLNTKEALAVLDKLKESQDIAALYVYFGIYRKNHYKGKTEFNPASLDAKLKSVISSHDKANVQLQGGIAWNFWRILEETPDQFNNLKPYLDLFFKLPYDKGYYSSLERIIEKWIEKEPEICIGWFDSMISKLSTYAKDNKDEAFHIWISPEKALNVLAQKDSQKLISAVANLVTLWEQGAFVGSPQAIFETYKQAPDVKDRELVKEKFKALYEKMNKLNPKLQSVSWED